MDTPVAPGAGTGSLPVLDRAAALERLDGDEDMLATFLNLLVEQSAADLPKIAQALEQGNAREVERLAHSLKGAAASLSAERVRQAAHQLELIGRNGNLSAGRPVLTCLSDEVDRLRAWLDPMARP
jgi:HPt (histidine-containing phosphotransfer) domain-containing protein